MLRFMLKPDKRMHVRMHKQTHIWKAFTMSRPRPLQSLQSEAIAPIIREKYGRFSVTTSFNLEAGVKGQIQHLKRFTGHDFLQVVFTFRTSKSNIWGDIRPF